MSTSSKNAKNGSKNANSFNLRLNLITSLFLDFRTPAHIFNPRLTLEIILVIIVHFSHNDFRGPRILTVHIAVSANLLVILNEIADELFAIIVMNVVT